MDNPREKFSSQAAPELLAGLRYLARTEGRHFQAVLEDAECAATWKAGPMAMSGLR